jgi:hypothetical protein
VPVLTLVTPGQHRRAPWRNGGGTTAEILAAPGPDGRFLWRLSIADVAAPGPFSDFAGYERHILLLSGNGFVLRLADGAVRRFERPLEPFTFDGGVHAECELLDGPVRDLNLIVARDAFRGRLEVIRPAAGARREIRTSGTAVVHLVRGALEADGVALGPGDTLRADGLGEGRLAVVAGEDAVAVLATVTPAPMLA